MLCCQSKDFATWVLNYRLINCRWFLFRPSKTSSGQVMTNCPEVSKTRHDYSCARMLSRLFFRYDRKNYLYLSPNRRGHSHAELKNTYCVYSSFNSLLWKTGIHKYLTKNKKNILIQRKIYRYKSIIKEGQFWLYFKDNLLVYYFWGMIFAFHCGKYKWVRFTVST